MLISEVEIFCDVDPTIPKANGKTFDVPPATGGYTLVGKGGQIEDELAARFGLKGDSRLKPFDEAKHSQAIEDRNRLTYETNAGATKAHQGYPAGDAVKLTAPEKAEAEREKAEVKLDALDATIAPGVEVIRRGRPAAARSDVTADA